MRAPEGSSSESALGVVVLDKAVEERFRTDGEFGQRPYTFNDSMQRFLGLDQQVAGVTLRDLQKLNMAKLVSHDLELLAELLLNQTRDYYPCRNSSDQYETNQLNVFGDEIRAQLEPVKNALVNQYVRNADYPLNLMQLNATLQVGTVAETVTVTGGSSGVLNNFMLGGVNASRSSAPGNAKLKTQDISTPRLREYFPETLVWQPSIETDKQGRAKSVSNWPTTSPPGRWP